MQPSSIRGAASHSNDRSTRAATKRRWTFLEDTEINQFLKARGSSQRALRTAMENCPSVPIGKGRGGKFKKQFHRKAKHNINFVKLWVTVKAALLDDDSFDWTDFVADILCLDEKDPDLAEDVHSLFLQLDKAELESTFTQEPSETLLGDKDEATLSVDFVPQSPPIFDPQPSASSKTTNATAKRPKRQAGKSILDSILANVCIGFGLDPLVVEEANRVSAEQLQDAINTGTEDVGLEDKISSVIGKIDNQKSSFSGYSTIINLFLLWRLENEPNLFRDKGMLLASPSSVYHFIMEYENGVVRGRGDEPYWHDVHTGVATWDQNEVEERGLSFSNFQRILNALTQLSNIQQYLMCLSTQKLRESPTIKNLEAATKKREASKRNENYAERQQYVYVTCDVIECKRKQSEFLLDEDSPQAIRLRAITIAQTPSVSRMDELIRWCICDLYLVVYSRNLPNSGPQDINCIYVCQNLHKNRVPGQQPDSKALVRHKDILLCPQRAVSLYLFLRFVLQAEEEIQINCSNEAWYDIRVFRSQGSRESPINACAIARERRCLMEKTETFVAGSGNHSDRRIGSAIARLSGVSEKEIESLGLWAPNAMRSHYLKLREAKTISRLAGFYKPSEYYIPRADLDPFELFDSEESKDAMKMIRGFLPMLDDLDVIRKAQERALKNEPTAMHVLDALSYLRRVAWQDLGLLYKIKPGLKFFQCRLIKDNLKMFELWSDMVYEAEADPALRVSGSVGTSGTDAQIRNLTSSVNSMARSLAAATNKINELTGVIKELRSPEAGAENQNKKREREELEGAVITSMRSLENLTLQEIWIMYNEHWICEGVPTEPLHQLEKRRRNEKGWHYAAKHLHTRVRRICDIAEWMDGLKKHYNNEDIMFKNAEDTKQRLKKNCSNYHLWEHIMGYLK